MQVSDFRKRQISQWRLAPNGAYQVFRTVDTGLSKGICEFVFYDRDNFLVTEDASDEVKEFLKKNEVQIR